MSSSSSFSSTETIHVYSVPSTNDDVAENSSLTETVRRSKKRKVVSEGTIGSYLLDKLGNDPNVSEFLLELYRFTVNSFQTNNNFEDLKNLISTFTTIVPEYDESDEDQSFPIIESIRSSHETNTIEPDEEDEEATISEASDAE